MKRSLKKQEQGLAKQSDKRPVVGDKKEYYEKEGVTQLYPAAAYVFPVEGDVEPEKGGKHIPLSETLNEIMEKNEQSEEGDTEPKNED